MKLYSLVQPDVVAAITARAHELRMPVTGHVPASLGLENAVLAGMDQIAHMSVRQPGTPDADRVIALLADRRVVIDPTQAWGELLGRARDVRAETIEPGIAFAPYPLAANYRSVLNNPRPATAAPAAPARGGAPRGPSLLKILYDKGVPIVAGTDGALPGYSLLREVELYVQAGLRGSVVTRERDGDARRWQTRGPCGARRGPTREHLRDPTHALRCDERQDVRALGAVAFGGV
jgi:imidazolonepropionase-like amidohydrolase